MNAVFCEVCGSANEAGVLFCVNCGARLRAPVGAPAAAVPARRASQASYLLVGAAIVIVALGAFVLLAGGGGTSSAPPRQAITGGTPTVTTPGTPPATLPAALPTSTQPAPTPTPIPPAFDAARATQLTLAVLNGASRLRGTGAEGPTSTTSVPVNLGVNTESYRGSSRPECANVVRMVNSLQTGRKGSAQTAFYRREVGPGGTAPSPLTTVGVVVEGVFAQVHVYESAEQVKANIDAARGLIANGELVTCMRVVASTVTVTVVAPVLPAGPGGLAWAYDDAASGRMNSHREEYAWQLDNLLIRVEFQGLPGFATAARVQDGLQAIADTAKQVSGR